MYNYATGKTDFITAMDVGTTTGTFYALEVASFTIFNGTTYYWPDGDGTSQQVIKTNGAGVFSWENDNTGGGSAAIGVQEDGVNVSSPIATINFNGDDFNVTEPDLGEPLIRINTNRFISTDTFSNLHVTVCASDVPDSFQCDYLSDGTDDQLDVISALDSLPGDTGKVVLNGGLFNFLINSEADQVYLSTGQAIELTPGTTISATISGGGNKYVFVIDGTTHTAKNIDITGPGLINIIAIQDNQGFVKIKGDVTDFRIEGMTIVNTDKILSDGPAILFQGTYRNGVRNGYIRASFEDWAHGSGDDEDGAIFIEDSVRGIEFDVNVKECSYGISAFYRDYLPTKVLVWDGVNSSTDMPNIYDGDVATMSTFTLSAQDSLLIGLDESRFQSVFTLLWSSQSVHAYPFFEFYNGTSWSTHTAVDETIVATAPFAQSGEWYVSPPSEAQWSRAVLQGTTAYWLKVSYYDSSLASVGIGTMTIRDIALAKMPHDLEIRGNIRDLARTGLQFRGVHRVRSFTTQTNIANHAVNHNSNETTVFSSGNDRYIATRHSEDYSTVTGTYDTMLLTRAAKFGILGGTYSGSEEACWEQSTGISDFHKTIGYLFKGVIHNCGREAVRIQGDDNLILGVLSDPGGRPELIASSAFRSFIQLEKTSGMTTPKNNVISAYMFDTRSIPQANSLVTAGASVTGKNYLKNAHWRNVGWAGRPWITDNGGALQVIDGQDNYAATAAPSVTDGVLIGYHVGSRWIDTTNDKAYICLDATSGAAVWTEVTASAGSGESNTASNVNTEGFGLFKQKTSVDLEFLGVSTGSPKIYLSTDSTKNVVFLDIGNVDHGDFTYAAGVATLDNDVVAAAEMADADHGDVSWSGGVATVDNVAAENIAAGTIDADVVASSIAVNTVGNIQMQDDAITTAEIADGDHGDFTYSGGAASLDANTVDTNELADATLDALSAYNTNGLVTQTSADTFTGRTLTSGDTNISISNGDGVSGNPTISAGSNLVQRTSTFTVCEFVAASAFGATISSGITGVETFQTTSTFQNFDYVALIEDATQYFQFGWTSPTAWDASTITFRAVWGSTTATIAQVVAFGLQGTSFGDGVAWDTAVGTEVVLSDSVLAVAHDHHTGNSAAVILGGVAAAGNFVSFRGRREFGTAVDTLTGTAMLKGIDVCYDRINISD
jgi:hypothetical protein